MKRDLEECFLHFVQQLPIPRREDLDLEFSLLRDLEGTAGFVLLPRFDVGDGEMEMMPRVGPRDGRLRAPAGE